MDIRWQQRFQNFEKAFLFLQTAVNKDEYNPIEIGGLVQAFEFTFELGWKTIKDYLYEQGVEARFPREAIKEAFAAQIIEDGHTWIEMLEKRNELSHTYNEEVAERAVKIIQQSYFSAIKQVYVHLKKQMPNG
ncbi:nucleotidyltransferase substrate binding protein [Dyadobacter sp. CY323]|uniref:nucleotidyltransferase substrate binding protein n=1 Tax=Dyadobacter sp. CY323 TaxID=2907302 RepID=UPI001F2EE018|nr:nucleotidyltransferase substrate binding protein [Dyadobacter sp. CY323]MCE6988494.1 nucleotidyltransferase substrate binding protein [Dyadobacter sp. CY323]